MVFSAIAGIFIFAIVCGVGFGVASADSSSDLTRGSAFGFGQAANGAAAPAQASRASEEPQQVYYEQSVLASTTYRSVDAGFKMIDAREEEQRAHAAAENAAAIERVEAEKAKQGIVQTVQLAVVEQAEEHIDEYDLPSVDWTIGRDDFLAEWTARIDAYLEGSPLAGYGNVFAEAAWDNGVDPRWSPAISNTESSKGAVCFMPYNAWGWGDSGWSDWETAIRSHVAGLAAGYGYCITPAAAEKYCPPNHAFWYATTISQMATI